MEVLKDEAVNDSIVTLGDFPYICCVCCTKRNDLRLFEDEKHLLDLFHAIRKTVVRSEDQFPRRICGDCVNKLGEISSFIDIAKVNDTVLDTLLVLGREVEVVKPLENGTSLEFELGFDGKSDTDKAPRISRVCRICLSQSSLTPFEEKKDLLHSFQNLTGLNVDGEIDLKKNQFICGVCSDKLEDISSFINASSENERELESVTDMNEGLSGYESEDASSCGGIDIKEEPIDSELADSTLRTYEAESKVQTKGKPFECDFCEKRFTRPAYLKDHLLVHTGEKPFECERCGKCFSQKPSLDRHLIIHTGEKPYQCDSCDKRFTRLDYLRTHALTHTGEHPFECEMCGRKYREARYLRDHMRTHTGEKPFKCDSCGKDFMRHCYLRMHILNVHTAVKRLKCDFCDKRFSKLDRKKQHMLMHGDRKPFECNCCDKTFTGSAALLMHLRLHIGEKPFECHDCGKKFSRKDTLKFHLKTHTGEKSFKCEFCQKNFRRKGRLEIHLRSHKRQET